MASFVALTGLLKDKTQLVRKALKKLFQGPLLLRERLFGLVGIFLTAGIALAQEPLHHIEDDGDDPLVEFTRPSLAERAVGTEATVSCGSLESAFEDPQNGTIGILNVKAIIDVSQSQYLSSIALIVDDADFDKLSRINKICESKVLVTLSKPHPLTFSLVKANFQDRRILGRVKSKLEKIWILPERYAQDLNQYYKF